MGNHILFFCSILEKLGTIHVCLFVNPRLVTIYEYFTSTFVYFIKRMLGFSEDEAAYFIALIGILSCIVQVSRDS